MRVSEYTIYIPFALALLLCLPLRPRVYTAVALHTLAYFIEVVLACSVASVLTVNGNQPSLCADLATYFSVPDTVIAPYEQECTVDRHRSRTESRSLEVSSGLNNYLAFTWSLVSQVAR